MKLTTKARLSAAVLLGAVAGASVYRNSLKYLSMGREAFLADQSARFDRLALVHHLFAAMVAGILLALAVAGIYEFVAFLFAKVLARISGERADGS